MAIDDDDYDQGVRPGKRKTTRPAPDEPEFERPSIETCPVKPLGKSGGRYVLMTPGGEIEFVRDKDLASPAKLAGLFDGSTHYLRKCFPSMDKPGSYVALSAGAWLMRMCCEAGFFSAEEQIRGAGTWRIERGKALLLHHGDEIEIRRERGSPEELPVGVRYGRHVYVASRPEAKPAGEAATRDEAVGLFALFDRWNYSHSQDPRVLLGWLGCAYLAGALRWRPHIWVTGDTFTGKSTLEGLVSDLVGSSALRAAEPTKMAIAQKLEGAARPVLLDEFERDIDPVKQDQVVQLARLASTEGQAGIIRGSPEGIVRTYIIRGCFWFSGIVPAPLKPQDRTRIYVIDLRPIGEPERGAVAELMRLVAEASALGPKLRTRAIEGFWRFQANERVIEAAILAKWGKAGRIVDQLGTLLAMSEMMLRDDVLSEAQAMELLGGFDEVRDDIIGRADETEAQDCLSHLLSTPVRIEHGVKTVGEMILEVRMNTTETTMQASGAAKELLRHGLRVVRMGGGMELGLAIARKHRGLAELFRDSHWAGGAWNAVLKRVPGSYAPDSAVRFAGEQGRARVFPLTCLPLDLRSDVERTQDGDETVSAPPDSP